MRFQEQQDKDNSDNPDAVDIDIKFSDDNKSFLFVKYKIYIKG